MLSPGLNSVKWQIKCSKESFSCLFANSSGKRTWDQLNRTL